jgi:hypothetical protein
MRTSSLLLVVIVLTLVPVTWAVEYVMVEPKDLQWEMSLHCHRVQKSP